MNRFIENISYQNITTVALDKLMLEKSYNNLKDEIFIFVDENKDSKTVFRILSYTSAIIKETIVLFSLENKVSLNIIFLKRLECLVESELLLVMREQGQKTRNTLTIRNDKKIRWQAQTRDIVELIYGLHYAGCFGEKEEVNIKQLAELFEEAFEVKIANQIFVTIHRTNSLSGKRCKFLPKLVDAFNRVMLEMDER